jgi:4-amino-4-deoxy-L-arabinose transferase-like glycosyltransferase
MRIIAILVLALLVRVGVYAANSPFPPLTNDDSVYDATGWNLAVGNGFSSAEQPPYERLPFRTPGYPAFIALVYGVAGRSPDSVRFVQIGLSLVTCLIIYLLARRLLTRAHALIASALYAVYPAAAVFPSLLLTESNLALWIILTVYLAYVAVERRRSILPYVAPRLRLTHEARLSAACCASDGNGLALG